MDMFSDIRDGIEKSYDLFIGTTDDDVEELFSRKSGYSSKKIKHERTLRKELQKTVKLLKISGVDITVDKVDLDSYELEEEFRDEDVKVTEVIIKGEENLTEDTLEQFSKTLLEDVEDFIIDSDITTEGETVIITIYHT